jgi:hypothetical protein
MEIGVMNKRSCFCGLFLSGVILCGMSSYATEYVYPTASWVDKGQEILLFTHQVGQKITIWSLNKKTGHKEQLLSSQYNPVGVRILPDKSGFSFLDNGLIKVKQFLKRSPRTIEIYEPIYNFGIPEWLTDGSACFFHAKQANRYGIYQVTLDGSVSTIIKSAFSDYIYPQKIDQNLFFIERNSEGQCGIMMTHYDQVCDKQPRHIYDFKKKNIIYLCMINKDNGFVVEHVPQSDSHILSFKCHGLMYDTRHDSWRSDEFFTFYLPAHFFIDQEKMIHDSMSVLFPHAFATGTLYFISLQAEDDTIFLYRYDIMSKSIEAVNTFLPIPKDILSYIPYTHCKNILMPLMTTDGLLRGCALD